MHTRKFAKVYALHQGIDAEIRYAPAHTNFEGESGFCSERHMSGGR